MTNAEGVHPDIIVCRTEKELTPELRRKIALFCNVKPGHVIQSMDAWSIYQVPFNMEAEPDEMDKLEIRLPAAGFALPESSLQSSHPIGVT